METANGQRIPNDQYRADDPAQTALMRGYLDQYREYGIRARTNPTGYYNCHGLTFGSRRAVLYDKVFLKTILQDDCYIKVPLEDVLPGDVILYVAPNGEYDHSGVVLEKGALGAMGILVCSKWGPNAEFIHWAHTSPYGTDYEFWRVCR